MQTRIEIHYHEASQDGELATYLSGILHEDGSVKVLSTLRTVDRIPAGTLLRPATWPSFLGQPELVLLTPEDRPSMASALAAWDGIARVAVAG